MTALAAALWMAASAHAQSTPPPPEPRELIYCADQMTHEEREAYRAKMRAARTAEEKEAVRQAHRQEMQSRVQQRGGGAQCEPVRLRLRGGRGQ
jgi:hypothetical protein